ncbi:MAG: TetR family transcriptional regulator [Acidimicrobiia bacterium]|nr:TetR family transcriptional regulator [Acidimicrobiia bacterium]
MPDTANPTTDLSRRDRKKQATRRAIARAALRLAQELGPDAVTIDAISEAADVSPRTVFNHFASKEDAILNVDPVRTDTIRAELAARPADEPPLASLRAVLLDASEQLDADLGDWRQRVRLVREHPASLYPRYVAAFTANERVLVELVAERLGVDVDHDIRPALLVAAAFSAMRVATDTWETSDRSVHIEDLIDEAFARLANGLT